MAKIRTFARIKPSDNLYDDFDTTHNRLYVRIPDSYSRDSTLYNRTRAPIVNHEFKYSQVFAAESTQEEVFDVAAKSILDGFLEGYNGTIFAYGQTSSGKTHTMHGNLGDSELKGLAPRSLSRIFSAVNARKAAGENISMHCSFLEIYQEVGYDLLKPVAKTGPGPTGFSKVTVVDGPQGTAVVKNLSILAVNSEDAAQSLLAQGELNRKVSETAMNNRSSRSHAVFTVYLSSRKGDLLVRSKMHFVDLAGSERVCKTGVKGLQLSEAKYINLSLHYLEGVIIALHQEATTSARMHTAPSGVSKSWSTLTKRPYSAADSSGRHIPYRNSLLTMLLKDSLGGNCLTTMIATISLDLANLSESISTCRFAQRVSCISNTARKNEEIDDKSMIKKLRTRVAELEVENNMLKHGGNPDPSTLDDQEKSLLTTQDKELCQHVVKDFLNGRLMDPIVAGVTDPYKFRECMSIFKKLIKENSDKSLRLAEKLKQQPSHIQEAFYTGGRYHEAPLANPSRRQEIRFRDDNNVLIQNAYANWQQRSKSSSFKPTILKSSNTNQGRSREGPTEAWQLKLSNDGQEVKKKQVRIALGAQTQTPSNGAQEDKPKPKSAAAAVRRISTPFQRKRNQEVTQLNKKVESNFAQQMEQANHLKVFKKTVVEQEFEVVIHGLTRKLEVTQHQLADQHAYTVKLQQQTTDKHLIEQEILVKRQLQKRVDRLHTELSAAKARLAEIKEQADLNANQHPAEYRTVTDKFSTMTKKDGTLDSVKVKTTLQKQEKLQNQLQKKIDRQRVLAIEKHLEVQEQSTRQKLEEFKRKLAESRQGQRPTNSSVTTQSISSSDINENTQTAEVTAPPKSKRESTSSRAGGPQPNTFQSRISEQKSVRERSIGDILSKYRVGASDATEVERLNQRTAQVDHILAKYTEGKNSVPRRKKAVADGRIPMNNGSVANSDPSANSRSISAASEKKHKPLGSGDVQRAYPVHTRIKVPNSEMQYDSRTINSAAHRQTITRELTERPRQESATSRPVTTSKLEAAGAKGSTPDNFQATLQTMLEHRQGHYKKRTDAWASTSTPNKTPHKQVKQQSFLMKQAKNKQQQTRRQEERKLQTAGMKSNHKEAKEPSKEQKSKRYLSNNKEFSHRMSHYSSKAIDAGNADRNSQDDNEVIENISNNVEDASLSQTIVPPQKNYANLRKLTKHNEHATQVRKIQSAAIKIQRSWRRHRYRLSVNG